MRDEPTERLSRRLILPGILQWCCHFPGSQVRVVTLEMLIILLKELIMYTTDNSRLSYLNDRHLALIEVQ